MANLLYRNELDSVRCKCGRPACEDAMFLHSNCHTGDPLIASYFDGVLTLACATCKQPVSRIAVARLPIPVATASPISGDNDGGTKP